VGSPSCSPEAAQWLVDTGAKAIGFDCFPERSAKKQSYLPSEFVVHEIIGEAGAILMQSLTNLGELPVGERFQFFGAFLKVKGGEGAPARFFAVLD
jgi:arylformamidase